MVVATTSYLPPPRPVSLHTLLDGSSSKNGAPHIELEWEPFQDHIEAFLNAIDSYTIRAKTEIAARASDHTASVRDLHADKDEMERRITLEREREAEMLATIETERHTLGDLTSSLSHLQKTLQKVKDQSAALEAELNPLKRDVKGERAEKERQGVALEEMRSRDGDELKMLEDTLGWRIQGVGADLLMMTFTLIDPSDPDKEFAITIETSKFEYAVPKCSPALSGLSEMVAQLNEDRDFFAFIKRVRRAFRALVPAVDPTSRFDDLSGPGLRAPGERSRPVSAEPPADGGASQAMDNLALQ